MLFSVTAGLNIQAFADIELSDGSNTVTVEADGSVFFTPMSGGDMYMFEFATQNESGEDPAFATLYYEGNPIQPYYRSSKYYYDGVTDNAISVNFYKGLETGERYELTFAEAHKNLSVKITHKNSSSFINKVRIKAKSKLDKYAYGKKFAGIDLSVSKLTRENTAGGNTTSYKTSTLKLVSSELRKHKNDNLYYYYDSYDEYIKNSTKVSKSTKLKGTYFYVATFKLDENLDRYFLKNFVDFDSYVSGKNIGEACYKITSSTLKVIFWVDGIFYAKNGVKYQIYGKKASVAGRTSKKIKNIKIKSKVSDKKVTEVNDYAFDSKDIKSVTFPSTVTKIGYRSFNRCTKLKKVKLPSKLKKVSIAPFESCKGITAFEISKDNKYFKTVNGALYRKKDNKLIHYPLGKKGTKYNVIKGTKEIACGAFYDSSKLKKVYIPKSVNLIERYAFSDSKITDIYYGGTKAQWKKALKNGNYLQDKLKIKIHYNAKKL